MRTAGYVVVGLLILAASVAYGQVEALEKVQKGADDLRNASESVKGAWGSIFGTAPTPAPTPAAETK